MSILYLQRITSTNPVSTAVKKKKKKRQSSSNNVSHFTVCGLSSIWTAGGACLMSHIRSGLNTASQTKRLRRQQEGSSWAAISFTNNTQEHSSDWCLAELHEWEPLGVRRGTGVAVGWSRRTERWTTSGSIDLVRAEALTQSDKRGQIRCD